MNPAKVMMTKTNPIMVMMGLTTIKKNIATIINQSYYSNMETSKKLIGYMVTWTTFGSWLQGDERKYVKDGQVLDPDPKLKQSNLSAIKQEIIKLTPFQRNIAEIAILQEAKRINQKIHAIAVCTNHIHLLAEVSAESIEKAVHRYKYSATAALRNYVSQNKIWSKGFDKRFCYCKNEIEQKIKYIQNHNENGLALPTLRQG
jgi:REP element-mobilizing transposase RayT